MTERTVLTSEYLYDQPFSLKRLQEIYKTHTGPGSTVLRTQKSLIAKITDLKVTVDWVYVFGKGTTIGPERAIDNLFRTFLQGPPKEVIIKPYALNPIQSSSPTEDSAVSIVGSPKDKDFRDSMDVDSSEFKPEFSSLVFDGPELYAVLEHCPAIDMKWKIQVLVKNCTEDPANPRTFFAVGVTVPLDGYDPKESPTGTSFFARSKHVIEGLDGTLFCPDAPWDAYWALPGFPWLTGPFARRHTNNGDIELNSSEAIFREIPVVGSENALRLMVVFKHPTDISRVILSLPPQEHDVEYVNQIKPYDGPGAVNPEEEIKPAEVKQEEDIKPGKAVKGPSTKTQAKNTTLNNWLIEYFTTGPSSRPVIIDLRETAPFSKEPRSIKRTVGWIQEMALIANDFTVIDHKMPNAPKELRGVVIRKGNWEIVVARSPTYYTKAIATAKFLADCKTEEDIKAYIDDDQTKVSIETLLAELKKRAWITAGAQPAIV